MRRYVRDTLYVLVDNENELMAISEDFGLINKYHEQYILYFSENIMSCKIVKGVSEVDSMLSNYPELVLYDLGRFTFTELEHNYYDTLFKELYQRYTNSIGEMISLNRMLVMDKDEHKTIDNAIDIAWQKLTSYEKFLNTLEDKVVIDHILIKPYMVKKYQEEKNRLDEEFRNKIRRV